MSCRHPSVQSHVVIRSVDAVEGDPTVLRVRWYPDTGTCPVDSYTVSYQLANPYQCGGSGGWGGRNVSGATAGTAYNITGLLPYSSYRVYVTAATAAGSGPISYARTGQTGPAGIAGLQLVLVQKVRC